jgi:hypothetical protein
LKFGWAIRKAVRKSVKFVISARDRKASFRFIFFLDTVLPESTVADKERDIFGTIRVEVFSSNTGSG